MPPLTSAGRNAAVASGLNPAFMSAVADVCDVTIHRDTTPVGNVGAGADTLMSYTLPAGSLRGKDGSLKGLRIVAWGRTANNVNAKTIELVFGSLALLTTALTVSQAGVWRIAAEVLASAVDVQEYVASLLQGGATTLVDVEQGQATQNDDADIIIQGRGTATSNDDIVQEGFLITLLNNA